MTGKEQLQFCSVCTNRKMDLQEGILCNLTNRKADFVEECKDYIKDATIREVTTIDASEELQAQEVIANFSERTLTKLREEQNYSRALIVGIFAGIMGAVIWGAITVATEYQIGYMAIAIGAAVGFLMREAGKGIDQKFGFTGAIIAVISCFLGNFFSIVGFLSISEGLTFFDTLLAIDYSQVIPLMVETFSPIDLLFYGIAGYEGYKFAFRTFTEEEVAKLNQ